MKSQRQAKIIEIISNTNVETPEQLLAALQEAGFTSTQATISRDIKELRIVKELTSFGTYRYTTAARELSGGFSNRLNSIFKDCVTGFDYAMNIIVIHTLPGLASAAASALAMTPLWWSCGTPIPQPLSAVKSKVLCSNFRERGARHAESSAY